jgi:hypothetical protein
MRFTFVILIFLSFGADAQMIIKAHANYRPLTQPVVNLLLDDYPNAAAAYSLRKLDKDYTGSAIRVRRSNDNSEQDIGFTSGGDLDTASLKTFVGANSGFVTTWYNQADSAGIFGTKNATNSTAAQQPRIVNAGTVDRENGKVSLSFDGLSQYLESNTRFLTGATAVSFYSACNFQSVNTAFETLFAQSDGVDVPNRFEIRRNSTGNNAQYLVNNIANNGTQNITNRHILLSLNSGGTSMSAHINNTLDVSSTGSSISINSYPTRIGFRNNTLHFGGKIQEIIVYRSDQSSNRTGIQNNINTYYSIY